MAWLCFTGIKNDGGSLIFILIKKVHMSEKAFNYIGSLLFDIQYDISILKNNSSPFLSPFYFVGMGFFIIFANL
jgi:hypothetical protein